MVSVPDSEIGFHSAALVLALTPPDAVPSETPFLVVSLDTLAVPEEVGLPVWSCAYNVAGNPDSRSAFFPNVV
jgi:hypothetical protein